MMVFTTQTRARPPHLGPTSLQIKTQHLEKFSRMISLVPLYYYICIIIYFFFHLLFILSFYRIFSFWNFYPIFFPLFHYALFYIFNCYIRIYNFFFISHTLPFWKRKTLLFVILFCLIIFNVTVLMNSIIIVRTGAF